MAFRIKERINLVILIKKSNKGFYFVVSLYLSTIIVLNLLSAFWRPDLHHDGWSYYSAFAQAKELLAGQDYTEVYGLVSTKFEGLLLKFFDFNLLPIRLWGFILNLLIAINLYLISRRVLDKNDAPLVSILWLSMNPVLTVPLSGSFATAQTWPNQYGALLTLLILSILIYTNKESTVRIISLSVLIPLLPFVRVQFFLHSLVLVCYLLYTNSSRALNYKFVILTVASLHLYLFIWFGTYDYVLQYFKSMFEAGFALRGTSITDIPIYYLRYFITSFEIFMISLFIVLMIANILQLRKNFPPKSKSLFSSRLAPTLSAIIIILVFAIVNTSAHSSRKNILITKGKQWSQIYWEKLPFIGIYCGLFIFLILICGFAFGKNGLKNSPIMFPILLISIANLSLLFDIPDVGRLWSAGGLYLILTFYYLRAYLLKIENQGRKRQLAAIRILIAGSLLSSFLGAILFFGEFKTGIRWKANDVFKGMIVDKSQVELLRDLSSFQNQARILSIRYHQKIDIYCPNGFYHLTRDEFAAQAGYWMKYLENKDKVGSLFRSKNELVGACDLNEEEIQVLKTSSLGHIWFFGSSILAVKSQEPRIK